MNINDIPPHFLSRDRWPADNGPALIQPGAQLMRGLNLQLSFYQFPLAGVRFIIQAFAGSVDRSD